MVGHEQLTLEPAGDSQRDDIARIVRQVMLEHDLDPSRDNTEIELGSLPAAYRQGGGEFFVVLDPAGRIVGTLGIKSSKAGSVGVKVCELTRMYLLPEYRGMGEGDRILSEALQHAACLGFDGIELETAPVFAAAIRLYRKNGFQPVPRSADASQCSLCFRRDL